MPDEQDDANMAKSNTAKKYKIPTSFDEYFLDIIFTSRDFGIIVLEICTKVDLEFHQNSLRTF